MLSARRSYFLSCVPWSSDDISERSFSVIVPLFRQHEVFRCVEWQKPFVVANAPKSCRVRNLTRVHRRGSPETSEGHNLSLVPGDHYVCPHMALNVAPPSDKQQYNALLTTRPQRTHNRWHTQEDWKRQAPRRDPIHNSKQCSRHGRAPKWRRRQSPWALPGCPHGSRS